MCAIGKESLESCLQGFSGARIEGGRVFLDPGKASEFFRRQVKENLALITQAASNVLGSAVKVEIGEMAKKIIPKADSGNNPPPPENDLLEKVKKEPVVRSFLDVFPGPVKAEKINS